MVYETVSPRRSSRIALYVHMLCCSALYAAADKGRNCTSDDSDQVCKALENPMNFPGLFYTTKAAHIVASVSGGVSVVSSILVVTIILRSTIGLSTIAHRLVFAMSIADIFISAAIALTTIPMPTSTIYNFEGPILGNELTCSVQGFFIWLGGFSAIYLNACIAIYFMYSITYKMKDAEVQRRIEPAMYITTVLATLPTAILFWINDWYNPTPFETFCTAMSYPWYCKPELKKSFECSIRGEPTAYQMSSRKWLVLYYRSFLLLGPVVTIYCMFRITRTVYLREKYLKTYNSTFSNNRIGQSALQQKQIQINKERHDYTKGIMYQAFGYIIANCLCNATTLLQTSPMFLMNLQFQILHTAVRPCQGLLNFFVFFGQKVHDRRVSEPCLSWKEAAKKALFVREKPSVILASLSMVLDDVCDDHDNGTGIYETEGAGKVSEEGASRSTKNDETFEDNGGGEALVNNEDPQRSDLSFPLSAGKESSGGSGSGSGSVGQSIDVGPFSYGGSKSRNVSEQNNSALSEFSSRVSWSFLSFGSATVNDSSVVGNTTVKDSSVV